MAADGGICTETEFKMLEIRSGALYFFAFGYRPSSIGNCRFRYGTFFFPDHPTTPIYLMKLEAIHRIVGLMVALNGSISY